MADDLYFFSEVAFEVKKERKKERKRERKRRYLRTSYDGRFFRPDVDYQDAKRSQEYS